MGFDCGFKLHKKGIKDTELKTKAQYESVYIDCFYLGNGGGLDDFIINNSERCTAKYCYYDEGEEKVVIATNGDESHLLSRRNIEDMNRKLEPLVKFLGRFSDRIINELVNGNSSSISKKEIGTLTDLVYNIDPDLEEFECLNSAIRLYKFTSFILDSELSLDQPKDYHEDSPVYEIIYWRSY